MTLLLTKWLSLFRRRRDMSLNGWLRTLPPEDLDRSFLQMHEAIGINKEEVPDVSKMSDLEFEDYIARLRRLNGVRLGL